MTKRSIHTILLAASIAVLSFAFTQADDRPALARREFGFSLNTNTQGDPYTLFLYTVYEGQVVDSRPMRTGPFILQACGLEESAANIESLDLFEEYGIEDCSPNREGAQVSTGFDCPCIHQLWKLRFRGAVVAGAGAGWAGEEFAPSARQQVLLQAYRQSDNPHWQGPYFGKDAFRLLRDLQDPSWVRMYRDGG